MKLYITLPSPFARKCRIVLRERGLADRVEEVVADPYASDPVLVAANPLVQVPALIAADGLPITDSPVICEYLDELAPGARLLPAGGAERLRVRRIETLANGALEMGVKLLLEKRRPESERSPSWMLRWTQNMGRALDQLETADLSAEQLHMGNLTAVVAATWIGFRHPDYDWSEGRPRLTALVGTMERRPSFVETRPT
jgi:glutathione S-transferase